jgi:integrase
MLITNEDAYTERLRTYYQEKFPEALKALQDFEAHFAVREPKGFSLSKVKSKKYGFLYYVRYIEKGKIITSRWCTHTNDLASAEQFARDNRERLLSAYHYKRNFGMYAILEKYYKNNSVYLETEKNRGRVLGDKTRSTYYNFIIKKLIPFLRSQRIKEFSEITPPVITRFQNSLLADGNMPQTINRFMGGFKAVLDYLVMHGTISENVFDKVIMLKVKKQNFHVRGCYEIDSVKGVFNQRWDDTMSYLLCLVIYATGMRNSEIEKIQVKDLITIDRVHFINIHKSKTDNGIRMSPLHPFVFQRLQNYISETGKREGDYLFSKKGKNTQSTVYKKAFMDMGSLLKSTGKIPKDFDFEKQGISFYSGRHYWKTVMNAEDLGDVEEYFMGHKVSNNVAKRYNHRDKQGKKKLLAKAKEVFGILDKRLFE